ncbi:MAG: NHL repeat-containing protein [Terracidiphilus sp.]|nr:NHL repeat-containing protein [Terracidiphilus sp.]
MFGKIEHDAVERGEVLFTSVMFPLLMLLGFCVGLVSGCGGSATPSTTGAAGVALSGIVHGGQQPVAGAKVYLYAAGSAGYGSAAKSLLNTSTSGVDTDGNGKGYVTTDTSGSFDIPDGWSCPDGSDQVYMLALEGNPGLANGTNNTALALMAALGTCSSMVSTYPNIVIDEVTTVASVWALRPFISDATHIGASSTNAAGLANAFAQVPNIVSIATGLALTKTPAANGAVPQSKIDTLADIFAPCVNSASGASSACSSLFSAATPSGKTQATDIVAAALYIAQNPGHAVSALFDLSTASAPFQPQLGSAPNDWMLFVTLSGGGLNGPASLGVNGSGALWVSNYFSVASAFSTVGVPLSATGYTGGGLNESYGMAIDTSNNIWFANEQSSGVNSNLGTITKLSSSGQLLSGSSGFYAGGIYFPIAVTADPNGNIWIVDYGDSKVTLLSSSGASLSGTTGWGGTSLEFPVALAVDSNHNAWVANQSANTITKISANGLTTTVISCCDGASGIATDQNNNVWVANYYGNSISEVDTSGTVLLNGITGGGVLHPQGIAVDGSGTVWVANYRGGSISEVSGSSSASAGTFLSPANGFGTDASLLEPYGLALDASGNVWVSNFGNDTITQFVGIATPIKTPFAGPPILP